MEPFEDENPFSTADPPLSSASSNSHVDVSAPSSPLNHALTLPPSPLRIAIQTSPLRTGLPSQGSGHSPRAPAPKNDFCCIRDHWLHSGEDVEILVSAFLLLGLLLHSVIDELFGVPTRRSRMHRRRARIQLRHT